jgi:hypothetical protein
MAFQREDAMACEPLRLVAPDVEDRLFRRPVERCAKQQPPGVDARFLSTPASVTRGVSGWRLGRVLLDPTCRTASFGAVTRRPPSPSQVSPSRRRPSTRCAGSPRLAR